MRRIWFLALMLAFCGHPSFSASAGDYQDNAVFLSHNYVKYQRFVDLVNSALGYKMQVNYQCGYWFVNVGTLTASGTIRNAATELAKVKDFLNAVKTYEDSHSYQFKLVAWLNGDKAQLDLSDATLRTAIIDECKKFLSTEAQDSYVTGADRVFDGICLDIEPSGNDDTYFNHYKTLMDEMQSSFSSGELSRALRTVAAHRYGTGNRWNWSPVYYYYMAKRVNFLVAMTYNSASASGAAYQSWITAQTQNILQAVSGQYWTDGSHPEPTKGVKVFIGVPGYPVGAHHDPRYENARYGALGILDGLTALPTDTTDPSANYFQAAAMYLHTDGSGADGYASYSTDWWWWGRYWLAAW